MGIINHWNRWSVDTIQMQGGAFGCFYRTKANIQIWC